MADTPQTSPRTLRPFRPPKFSWSELIRHRDFGVIADFFKFYFFWAGIAALFLSGIAAGIDKGPGAGFRVFGLSLLFAAASTVSGWILGLLFGIPRTLARPQPAGQAVRSSGAATGAPSGDAVPAGSPTSRTNTNLEDISDWLTKTIVGVGLTQLYSFPHYMWYVAGQLNVGGFGWDPSGRLLALALFLYFAPGGFWLGYVGTRTILTGLFGEFESIGDVIGAAAAEAAVDQAARPQDVRLDLSERRIAPAENGVAEADRLLLRVPFQALSTAREKAAWGAAQARAGDLRAARTAFEQALQAEPGNVDFKQQLATVYTALGQHDDATRLIQQVPNTDIAVHNALYEPPPEGFQKAIRVGETLIQQPGQEKNAMLHVWLACAYGQQHGYEISHENREQVLKSSKDSAVREIEAAIAADPRTRGLLRSLWRPEPSAVDRDLESFGPGDPDLSRLLGTS